MSCTIRNKAGEVTGVLTDKGTPSELYKSLEREAGEMAEGLYKVSQTSSFKESVIKPKVTQHINRFKQLLKPATRIALKQEKKLEVQDLIERGEITYTNEEGNLCAASGLAVAGFSLGGTWALVEDLAGEPSHRMGGVDLQIGENEISYKNNQGEDIKAEDGLLVANEGQEGKWEIHESENTWEEYKTDNEWVEQNTWEEIENEWEVVEDLVGEPSHKEGGVDLEISEDGVEVDTEGNTWEVAEEGLDIPSEEVEEGPCGGEGQPPCKGKYGVKDFAKDAYEAWFNPKNIGVKEYGTKEGGFDDAYTQARNSGEKKFMYQNRRYNTNYDGTPEEQLRETGITDSQLQNRNIFQNNLSENLSPYDYDPFSLSNIQALVGKKTKDREIMDKEYNEAPDKYGGTEILDAINFYSGKPQKGNTLSVSKDRPSNSKNPNETYYKVKGQADKTMRYISEISEVTNTIKELGIDTNNILKVQKLLKDKYSPIAFSHDNYRNLSKSEKTKLKKLVDPNNKLEENDLQKALGKLNKYNTETGGLSVGDHSIMRNYSVGLGSDDKGKYISYYDLWDMDPVDYGKPYELYERVHYKDYGDGENKRMFYSDKELSKLNKDQESFNTLNVQKELSNRGYQLPKSTKEDGSFDGVYGEEIKKALLDYQKKKERKTANK